MIEEYQADASPLTSPPIWVCDLWRPGRPAGQTMYSVEKTDASLSFAVGGMWKILCSLYMKYVDQW